MTAYPHPPQVKVGILTAETIRIRLESPFRFSGRTEQFTGEVTFRKHGDKIEIVSGDKSAGIFSQISLEPVDQEKALFLVYDVTIGIGFHWQKSENQSFRGSLTAIPLNDGVNLINILYVEDYLTSVISSEMRATSSPELLRAHAVISRSWLLAQIEKRNELSRQNQKYQTSFYKDDEIVRWYDREDHDHFDVCADDHCQRYQGVTRAFTPEAREAVIDTSGEVLVYNDNLCDARFSKCCGGITEQFENTWEPVAHAYLQRVYDFNGSDPAGDLKSEENAVKWILTSPPAFCNTSDKHILSQVLNDYDQNTQNFYRWTVTYGSDELSALVKEKTGIDFGDILGLDPLERGVSGRIIRLRITGSKRTMIIGKELEIRKALSHTHLYSSAFIIEKKAEGNRTVFILHGAGWGHGVGLCQIGAAVMGARGYGYKNILLHYFRGAEVRKAY